jgi:hypothetical protein
VRFATIQYGDHRKDGKPFWDWTVFEGNSVDDRQAVQIASQSSCLSFLRGGLSNDVYYLPGNAVIRDHTRSRWRSAGCSNTMGWPDQEQTLVNGLTILFADLDPSNIKVLPPL